MANNGQNDSSNGNISMVPKFSGFKFSKAVKPKSTVVQSVARLNAVDDSTENDNIDFVTSIDGNQIKGTKSESSSSAAKELIIPLIAVNKYKISKSSKAENVIIVKDEPADEDNAASNGETDLASKAKKELIQDGKNYNELEDPSAIPAWKLMVINKVPDEYENDNKLDVSIRPEVPTLDDYDSVPVEAFGSALLRGMGWKQGDPIGGINKSITPIFEPQLRPRGLGLGADASILKQLKESGKKSGNSQGNEPLLKQGSFVCVEVGPFKGRYGTVQSIGDDLSHVQIKLSLTRDNIDIPQAVLRVVSKKEFDEEGRILNKASFDDYKLKDGGNGGGSSSHSSETEKNHKSKESHFSSNSKRHSGPDLWIIPNIRVEIRDKKYKDGKYYKEKVAILETKGYRCTCRTKSHRILEDVPQSMLRTVIPRKSATVMVVRGEHRGKLAILEHIGRLDATIQLTGTISKSFVISLDDISELYNRN